MKSIIAKILFSFFFSLFVFTASGQMQRTFFGNTLGDTKASVMQTMRLNGYTPTSTSNSLISFDGLSFGGVSNWTVTFYFDNGVNFNHIKFVHSENSSYSIFRDLSSKLKVKYYQYTAERISWCPDYGRREVVDGYRITGGDVTCFIHAMDFSYIVRNDRAVFLQYGLTGGNPSSADDL